MSEKVLNTKIMVVKPPTRLSILPYMPSIFLAGSIEMGAAENWQTKVEKELEACGREFLVLNPRRDDWDSTWEQKISNLKFYEQVNWELDALYKADVIALYFDKNTKSPISLLELGLFAHSGKLVVCCPDGFWRQGNVEIVCQRFGVPFHRSYDTWILNIKSKLGVS